MIQSLIWLIIYVILAGLGILGLMWVVEYFFEVAIPRKVKVAVGIIAMLLIALYALRAFGIA